MRLDHDFARTLLQKVGEMPFDGSLHTVRIEGRSEEETSYHIMLLHQAGLIEAVDASSLDGVCWYPKYLTYAGNEFLAAAESDTVWNKAKSIVWAGTKTVTLEALKHTLPLAMKALMPGGS